MKKKTITKSKKAKKVVKKVAAKKKKVAVKKPAPKKTAVKKSKTNTAVSRTAMNKPVGTVTHFYTEISVAIVRFNTKIPAGTILHFRGATTDFKQQVASMQYDHEPVAAAPKGKLIGIKVKKRVREGDAVHVHNG
jgi:hypothetical protein